LWWFAVPVNEVPYVNTDSAARAREWERRLQAVPGAAGFLFIGVTPLPELGGESSVYEVRVGVRRGNDPETVRAVIKHTLTFEFECGAYTIRSAVYAGIPGSASTDGRADRHSP
jgi:hypothetical protein